MNPWLGWALYLVCVAVFAAVVVVGMLFAPFFVNNVLAPGFDTETSALAASLTRLMLIQPVILAAFVMTAIGLGLASLYGAKKSTK